MSAQADTQPTDRQPTPPAKLSAGAVTRRTALALGPAAVLAAACSSNNKPTPKTNPTDSVTYVTGFGTFGREGDVVIAEAKGFFRDAGLNVTVRVGSGQPTETTAVAAGKSDFLATETSQYIIQLAKGIAKGTKAISAIHQRTVIALMALSSSGIQAPTDLALKPIGYGAPAPLQLFPAYAKLAGFNGDLTNWKMLPVPQLPALLAQGKVAAIGQFLTGLPAVQAAVKGAGKTDTIVTFPYSRYLNDLYGNINITRESLLEQKPDVVKRFNTALLKGLQYAVENPDEAGVLINKKWSTTPAPVAQAELTVMKEYVVAGSTPIGALDQVRVAQAIALMAGIGVVNQGVVTPDQFADFNVAPKA